MGRQTRNPWNVLLFFLVIITVAYLCKRGWDGFYDASTGVYSLYSVGSASGDLDWNGRRSGNYPNGSGVQWIWNLPVSQWGLNQQLGVPISFYNNYNNTAGPIPVTVMAGVDDHGSITINSTSYGTFSFTATPFQVILNPGNNTIQLTGINTGGPAGLWFAMKDNNGRILLKTDSTSGWSTRPLPPPPVAQATSTTSTGYTPANVPLDYLKFLFQQAGCNPINLTEGDLTVKFWRKLPSMDAIKNDIRGYAVAYSTGSGTQAQKDYCQPPSTGPAEGARYMPSQTRNTNIKKTTKTCATCPSAPLLGSLPTPSIAHNVNLPHYCQRITDDGGL